MKYKFPHIRDDSNFWLCGMGYFFFWYILFALYCLHHQYSKIRIYRARQRRLSTRDDTFLLDTKPPSSLEKVIQLPYTTDMISIKLILFTTFFTLANVYFAVFFEPYIPLPYHPGVLDRRAAFTGMVDWSIVFVLIQRNSILPRLTGLSFEELIPLHRIIARIGIINFLPHCIYRMYYGWFEQHTVWAMFFKDVEYTTGTIAMWASIAIFFTSFEYIRRYHFEFFFYGHILFAIITILGTLFHYPTCFVFFMPAVLLWLTDRLVRTWKSRFVPSSFIHVDTVAPQTDTQEGIVRITVENKLLSSFYPGQYVFAAMIIEDTFWEHWHWHPFTISEIFHVPQKNTVDQGQYLENQRLLSDVPDYQTIEHDTHVNGLRQRHQIFSDNTSTYATIHIKALGTKTRKLLECLNDEKKTVKVYLDGLYGPRLTYQDYRVVGLFATGIGVTPALVVMKDVIEKRYQGIYTVSVNKIYLIWSIRHTDEMVPFLDLFMDWIHKSRNSILPIQLYISVYVTRLKTAPPTTPTLPFQFYYGSRPNVQLDMDRIQKENMGCKSIWTHVCGSTPFTRDVINQAVDHGFQIHHETFEF